MWVQKSDNRISPVYFRKKTFDPCWNTPGNGAGPMELHCMQTTIPYKTCLSCGRSIRGRSDKKFCDDQCRNQYNNGTRDDPGPLVRTIQYFLRKNRRVLHGLIPEPERERIVTREQLMALGFSFRYHTHCTSEHRHYCYDHWYRALDEEQVLIGREVS